MFKVTLNPSSFQILEDRSFLTLEVNGKLLPHGSGIDFDWSYEDVDRETVKFSNSYHTMDEHGSYCCIVPFSVTMTCIDGVTKVTDIEVADNDCQYCYTEDLDDYLWQTFSLDFDV